MDVDRDRPPALRSGELARRAGVSPDTLRAYERKGLLPQARRATNGYRLYPPEALKRVELIQAGLAFGFTLSELGRFLDSRRAGHPPCREVRDAAKQRLSDIDEALAELHELRDALAGLIAEWNSRAAGSPPRRALHLLETLPRSAARRAGAAVSARKFSRAPGARRDQRKETP